LGLFLGGLCLAGCGGGSASSGGAQFGGQVLERAEGFSARPDWADPNQPLRQNGSALSFIGALAIEGDQSLQMGYRASDSYARAELLRFLRTRVVAVLFDQETNDPARRKLEEIIDESAEAFIGDWSIEAHYWEKTAQGGKTKLLVFSRLDVDAISMADLFTRAAAQHPDAKLELVGKKVQDKFPQLVASAQSWNEAGPVASGVTVPAWAKAGDGEDADNFTFVCQGTAAEEDKALSLAAARCNEKLCRLFGVKLRSQLSVKEDLNGLEAKSEVSETCDVRVQGRKTLNKGGECGPSGCTFWLRQSYPRASYDEEKTRLAQPTIVRQEVVIQEGDKHYRDPAACEQNLRQYGNVDGYSAESFRTRKGFLGKALATCEGIDGRDSGLFFTLNTLLVQPLEKFGMAVNDDERLGDVSPGFAFTLIPKSWRSSIDTDRFLTERITKVYKLVDGAILPRTLIELGDKGGTAAEVEAAMTQVVRFPFVNRPSSIHHRWYIHDLALQIGKRGRAPVSPRYRRFLLDQVARADLSCGRKRTIPAGYVIQYFAYDGTLDDEEWQAALKVAQGGEPDESSGCYGEMIEPLRAGSQRTARIDQVAEKIASGAWRSKNQFNLFQSLLYKVEADERLALFLRYESRLTGKPDSKESLISNVVRAAFGFNWDWTNKPEARAAGQRACAALPERVGTFFRDHPEAKTSDSALCLCLRVEGLSTTQRKALTSQLFQYADETCGEIRPEDWPEEYYSPKEPEYPKSDGPEIVSKYQGVMGKELKACIDQHNDLKSSAISTYLTVSSTGGRFSNAIARVNISADLRRYQRKDKRRGYITAKEMKAMQQNLEACFSQAANQFSLPPANQAAQASGTVRLWFRFLDDGTRGSGYLK
jgi:hypothetical protein